MCGSAKFSSKFLLSGTDFKYSYRTNVILKNINQYFFDKMRSLFYIVFLIQLSIIQLSAQSDSSNTFLLDKNQSRQSIVIGKISIGRALTDLSDYKTEAAVTLAAFLSGKYLLIPITQRDSVAKTLSGKGIDPSLIKIANELLASKIVFANINRIENIIRIDLTLVDVKDKEKKQSGTGYAFLKFKKGSDDNNVFDPPLLTAFQRAFASALADSNLYAHLQGNLRVMPAAATVIAGVEFVDDSYLPPWKIFDEKLITSFETVETIFKAAKNSPRNVVYDVTSRDAIYSIFNLYFTENHKGLTSEEIDALRNFQVENYITGYLRRIKEGAELSLFYGKITKDGLTKLKEKKVIIPKDDQTKFLEQVTELTNELFAQ